jgi:arginyl-tRNA synthetase
MLCVIVTRGRSERLALCAATAKTIRLCMELLGLNPIDKM